MLAQCASRNLTNDLSAQPVEISGWDAEGEFFAEIANLDLSDSRDATVRLCHCVYSGTLVFVRLLHGEGEGGYEKGYPTANEAQAVEPPDFHGRSRIRLIPCQPRATRRRGDLTGATRI
jgi:hypothetical protein